MGVSFNKIILMGNLTRDPERRYLPSGQAVTTFTVAMNRRYVAPSGEKKEEVSFVKVVAWAERAEDCYKFLHKSSPVFVEGRLQSRSWEKDGDRRSTVEVIASKIQFLGKNDFSYNDFSYEEYEEDEII
jgi:single-strand DNA-binding protein